MKKYTVTLVLFKKKREGKASEVLFTRKKMEDNQKINTLVDSIHAGKNSGFVYLNHV